MAASFFLQDRKEEFTYSIDAPMTEEKVKNIQE